MFKKHSLLLVFAANYLMWASCTFVNAGLILGIDPLNSTTKQTVSVGTNFTVPFYLIQNGSESRLSSFGLFSFDFRGFYNSSKLEFVSAKVDNPFDLLPGSNSSIAGQFDMFGAASSGVMAPANNILLGTVTLKALALGSSFLTLSDTAGDGFILNDIQNNPQTVLDPLIFGSQLLNTYTFEIQAVPEPSTFLLLSFVGFCLFLCKRSLMVTLGKSNQLPLTDSISIST